jgi:GAF domain-containing protein
MTAPQTAANADHRANRELQLDQVEDLIKLQKAAQKITSILELDDLVKKITTEVVQSFGCIEANIYLHDEERNELVLAGVCGCTLHEKGSRKKIGERYDWSRRVNRQDALRAGCACGSLLHRL